jgi:hypothetical protein
MQLTIEISEQDLLDFGRQTVERELQATLEWLRLRNRLSVLAKGLRESCEEAEYEASVARIRAEAWQEYKQGLEL